MTRGTVIRNTPLDYYDEQGQARTAPANTQVQDYFPVDRSFRGLKMGPNDVIEVEDASFIAERGTLPYVEEPMTTADRLVYRFSDGTNDNVIELAVAEGTYRFRVVAAGQEVAALDTGVAPEIFKRKAINAKFAFNAFYAAASGGSVAADTSGAVPAITRCTIGETGHSPGQCWIMDFAPLPIARRELSPAAVKILAEDLLLVGEKTLAPYVQVTRNTPATYWDAHGVLQTAAIDEPRFDYDPATGEYRGLLKEQLSENYVRHCRDLANPAWQNSDTNVTPDGDWFVIRRGDVSANNTGVYQNGINASGTGCAWAIVSPGTTSRVILAFRSGGYPEMEVDLSTEEVISAYPALFNVVIRKMGPSSWLVAAATDGNGYPSGNSRGIRVAPGGSSPDDTIRVFAAQYERSSYVPTSLMVTDDAVVARAADDIRVSDLVPFNGFAEGTFVVEYETQVAPSSLDNRILSRGANARLLSLRGPQGAYTYDGNSVEIAGGGVSSGSHVYALAFGDGTQSLCINGGPVKAAAWNGTWGSGDLLIGELNWSGWIKSIRWIPRRVSDAELQALTS